MCFGSEDNTYSKTFSFITNHSLQNEQRNYVTQHDRIEKVYTRTNTSILYDCINEALICWSFYVIHLQAIEMQTRILVMNRVFQMKHMPKNLCPIILYCVMMTSSNGNIFRVTGALFGEFTGLGEFPAQKPVTRSFDVFFDLCPNKRLSKQPRGWWFETPSWSLWRHCNVINITHVDICYL